MVYDTLYAHQDKTDDAKLKLKSSALTFGEHTKPILYGFSAASATLLAAAGTAAGMAAPYYISVAAAGSHLFWQVYSADLEDRSNLNARFVSNARVGAVVMAGIAGSNLV